jgi:ATP-dependent Clp protease ATP-binding subunit ClpB
MAEFERFTVKAGEAIQSSARLAREMGHPEIAGAHLLSALLAQQEGIVRPVLDKAGVRVPLLRDRLQEALGRYARVEGGGDPTLARDLRRALVVA